MSRDASPQQQTYLGQLDLRGWAAARGATWIGPDDASRAPRALSTDTRTLAEGDLFVALVGERFDAHDFLAEAHARGARVALVSRQPEEAPEDLALIVVEDTLRALQDLAHTLWLTALEAGVLGVALTGSNGKTTTKELLRALWSQRHVVHATSGNLNNHIGLPLTICALPLDAEVAILEMGASKRGDISELIAIAPSQVRLITSIGNAHLEGMGGLHGVRLTKREIFEGSDAQSLAVMPQAEREVLAEQVSEARVVSFGPAGEGAEVAYEVLGSAPGGMRVRITLGAEAAREVVLPLYGEHQASNLAAALATLWQRGELLSDEELEQAMARLHVPGGRGRRVEVGGYLFLDDSYNANPSSMLASFDAFLSWQAEQGIAPEVARVAIIGEMKEVGAETKKWHQHVARRMVERGGIQALVCVGPHAEAMREAALEVGSPQVVEIVACEDAATAAKWLTKHERGVIFLKASRGARLERLIEIIQDGCAP